MKMVGRLILSGGGDEKQTFKLDEVFLKGISKILYIPVAWPNNDFQSCLKWFHNAMSQHKKVEVEMLTDLSKEINLKKFDAVYIGGGNTFKLLKQIKDNQFDFKLLEFYKSGGIVYGGSAGAIIWGNDINIALICKDADVNQVQLKDTRGINMIRGYDIQCHYEDNQIKEHLDYINKTGRKVIAIPEESALLLKNNKLKVIGEKPVTIFISQKAKKVEVGNIILT